MRFTSWKTTTTGILMILGAVVTIVLSVLQTGHLPSNLLPLLATLAGGVGLISARDNDKTSEETGAKLWEAERNREELNK